MRREVIKKHTQKDATRTPAADALPRVRKAKAAAGRRRRRGRTTRRWRRRSRRRRRAAGRRTRAAALRGEPSRRSTRPAPAPRTTRRGGAEARASARAAPPAARGELRAAADRRSSTRSSPTAGMDKARLFEKAQDPAEQVRRVRRAWATWSEIHPGPVVTTYEFKPDAGIKYSKIVGLADDLALALEAESIRIDRMSGRGTVGIEIPNEVRETISLREILESDAFRKAPSAPDPGPGQDGERRDLRHRPRHHAPPADRGLHRHRQERRPQLHDREHPLQGHARTRCA